MMALWVDQPPGFNEILSWLELGAILAIFYLRLKGRPTIKSIAYYFCNNWLFFFLIPIACAWNRGWPLWGHTSLIFLFMIIFGLRFAFLSIAIYPAFIEISGLTNKEESL